MQKLKQLLLRNDVLLLTLLTISLYFLMEMLGIFRLQPAKVREILHSIPFLAFSGISALFFFLRMVAGGKHPWGVRLMLFSLLIFHVALWTSFLTRFEGQAIRFEGQAFNSLKPDFNPDTLYMGPLARVPAVGINLLKITPAASENAQVLKKVEADIVYAGETTGGVREGKLSSRIPFLSDWTFISIRDFGYNVRFVIKDLKGKELDSDYVYMKLFPPGAEDYFVSFLFGYLFSLRCYPDYADRDGKPASLSAHLKNPVLDLRIVRNKDIVYNGLITPKERLKFDALEITFPEVGMWVEYSFVRDFGIPVAGFAIVLFSAGVALTGVKRWRRGTKSHD